MTGIRPGERKTAVASAGIPRSLPRQRRSPHPRNYPRRYATFARLAGATADDGATPATDSLDVWDLIAGHISVSPRTEWAQTPLGENATRAEHGGDACYVRYPHKLLVGRIAQNGWPGQIHPNLTVAWDSFSDYLECPAPGCLFDVVSDPSERFDLAATMPDLARELYAALRAVEFYDPDRGAPDPRACEVASDSGYWGPFLP